MLVLSQSIGLQAPLFPALTVHLAQIRLLLNVG